jgi:hypothetical protein
MKQSLAKTQGSKMWRDPPNFASGDNFVHNQQQPPWKTGKIGSQSGISSEPSVSFLPL